QMTPSRTSSRPDTPSRDLPPLPVSESVESLAPPNRQSTPSSSLLPGSPQMQSYIRTEESEIANPALLYGGGGGGSRSSEDDSRAQSIPPQPRFLGAAFYDQNGLPRNRYSLASSIPSVQHSDVDNSVYNFNDSRNYGSKYEDEPNLLRGSQRL